MASLTPGVLSKLLQNAGDRDVKVARDHRSPLLQVIEIVPSLPDSGDDQNDDLWQSRGFFLRVSDSLHSAYVSISTEDLDLIYSDKIQLGQFVYVSRLEFAGTGSAVPVIRGLKPVPRRRPCVGNPTDLVSSEALPISQGRKGFSKSNTGQKDNNKLKKSISIISTTNKSSRGGALFLDNRNMNNKVLEDRRRLSLDSARRMWGQKPSSKNGALTNKTAIVTPPLSSKQISIPSSPASLNKCFAIQKHQISSISHSKNKDVILSPKPVSRVSKNIDNNSSSLDSTPNQLIKKIPIDCKTPRSDPKISWNSLPSTISSSGKHTIRNRNCAFSAAVRALEEASAMESVIHCLCTFSRISESSGRVSAGPLVEQVLDLHQNLQQALLTLNSLINKTNSEANSCNSENAKSWAQAAISTNLSKFRMFRDMNETRNGERGHYIVLENTKEYSTGKLTAVRTKNLTAKREEEEWSRGSGLKDAASLAENLLLVYRQWFLKYLEDSLNTGFNLDGEEGGSESLHHLLRQLKRVNSWFEELVKSGMEVDHKIDQLKKKLYRFILNHVDFAAVSSK